MVVQIKVNDVEVSAIIDTAAQVTVMSSDYYDDLLDDKNKHSGSYLRIKGIRKDLVLPSFIAKDIPFTSGKSYFRWDVHVIPIEEVFIIGLDFMLYQII